MSWYQLTLHKHLWDKLKGWVFVFVFFSQFHLCRIEEEESDQYNIPAKVESEKYRVIRTFSFLKSRMSSTRNKSKVGMLTQNSLIRNPPVGATDAFSYFQLMEIFIMLQVQNAGSWPRHGICDSSCSLWDTSRKCFWKYLKVGVTDQTWCPASFLLMINPVFWSQQRLEAFPDLHLLFMLCSIS